MRQFMWMLATWPGCSLSTDRISWDWSREVRWCGVMANECSPSPAIFRRSRDCQLPPPRGYVGSIITTSVLGQRVYVWTGLYAAALTCGAPRRVLAHRATPICFIR